MTLKPRSKFTTLKMLTKVNYFASSILKKNLLDMILAVAVTSDNKYIVSGATDKVINIFDFHSKELVHRFEKAHESKFHLSQGISSDLDWFSTLTVTPDSKLIVSAGLSNPKKDIKLFDIQTKQQVHHFQDAHEGSFFESCHYLPQFRMDWHLSCHI